MGEEHWLGVKNQRDLVQVLAGLIMSCVTVGRSFHFSKCHIHELSSSGFDEMLQTLSNKKQKETNKKNPKTFTVSMIQGFPEAVL